MHLQLVSRPSIRCTHFSFIRGAAYVQQGNSTPFGGRGRDQTVYPARALTAADHQHHRLIRRKPKRLATGALIQSPKIIPHRRAGHLHMAIPKTLCGRRHAHQHLISPARKQTIGPTGHGIGFMQKRGRPQFSTHPNRGRRGEAAHGQHSLRPVVRHSRAHLPHRRSQSKQKTPWSPPFQGHGRSAYMCQIRHGRHGFLINGLVGNPEGDAYILLL